MTEQLISFETAKLANEKGFEITGNQASFIMNNPNGLNLPTQSLLQKWLREKHNIDIYVKRDRSSWRNTYWDYFIEHLTLPSIQSSVGGTTPNTYEEALEVALFEALKLIP